jgi:DNA-3-methyladenine glycosylase II
MTVSATLSTPDVWEDACKHLAKRDRMMSKLIPTLGARRLQSRGDAFTTLARSIVGQQISVKSAQAVWDRFVAAMPGAVTPLQPENLLRLPIGDLRLAGLSARKAEYLNDLARHFAAGLVREHEWAQMPDEAIIKQLVEIRGVGRWTTPASSRASASTTSAASRFRVPRRARWATPGRHTARWPPGSSGEAWIRCP